MQTEYDRNIILLEGAIAKVIISGIKLLISCKVVHNDNSKVLEIAATDVKTNYWEIILSHEDFCSHLETLGIFKSDWKTYFLMMSDSFDNKLVTGEISNPDINLHIDYPMGEAKLRGTFRLKHIKNPAPQLIADLVFDFIEKIEKKNLKRIREPSPEHKQIHVEPIKAKPKAIKKKNPKQIGSKII